MQLIYKDIEYEILVDEEDLPELEKYHWYIVKRGELLYVKTRAYLGKINGKYKYVDSYLHRFILKAKKNKVVDHINNNPFDNRKENLRLCTNAENCRNQKIRKNNKSGYKGVYRQNNKWVAQINQNGNSKRVGSFDNIIEAVEAYNTAARNEYGEFAKLNII